MSAHRSSVPLDSTADSLKTAFSSHPILSALDDEQRQKFVKIQNDLHTRVLAPRDNQAPIGTEELWTQWRTSDILDDMALYRFLYGYQWDVDFAANMCTLLDKL
jgi:hypothetical protein